MPVVAGSVRLACCVFEIRDAGQVSASEEVRSKAKGKGVELRKYDVIYALLEDVKGMMEGMLPPTTERLALGEAEVCAHAEFSMNLPRLPQLSACPPLG